MKRCFFVLVLVSFIIPAFAQETQEVNLSGTWQVYRLNDISRYTLSEHQNPQASAVLPGSGTMTLNEDGTVVTDISSMNVQTWQMDDGFVVFTTLLRNMFYRPRKLSETVYLLVQIDLTERNEDIIALNSRPQGNLILIQQ